MKRPNVLFLTVDQLRTDALGCYGGTWSKTPNIDALAAQGVRFEQAYAAAPECVPSRTTWLTGRYPLQHGSYNNHYLRFPDTRPLLYRAASDAGYTVAMLGKTHYRPELTESDRINVFWPYWNTNATKAGDIWRAPSRMANETLEALLVRAFDATVAFSARAYGPDKPWFVHLSFVNPHPPNLCENLPIGWQPLPKQRCPALRLTPAEWNEQTDNFAPFHMYERTCYGATVEYVDAMVGEALKIVNLETTFLLFTSDHGDMLGDHGVKQKSVFFDAAWRVPLVLAGAGVELRSDASETHFACGADVPMTLRRVMSAPLSPGHRGVDLRKKTDVARNKECRGFLMTFKGEMLMGLVNATHKIVINRSTVINVFNRTPGVDPYEMNSLV